jgi:hypothetical protein
LPANPVACTAAVIGQGLTRVYAVSIEENDEPLRCFPEFRDLVVLPAATSAPGANRPSRPAMPVSPARASRRVRGEISPDEPTVPQQTTLPTEQDSTSQIPLIQLGDKLRDTWPAWLQLGILFLLLLGSAAAGFLLFFKGK